MFVSQCFCHVIHLSPDIAESALRRTWFLCMDWAGQREFILLILVTDKRIGGYIQLGKLQTYPSSCFPFLLLSIFFFKGICRK